MPPRKKEESAEPEQSVTTTLAVDRDIAARVKKVAKDAETSALEVTNKLLLYALEHATISVARIEVKITPKKSGGK